MTLYARLNPDGTLTAGPTVTAADYQLPGDNPADHGWTEHPTLSDAYTHYGLTPPDDPDTLAALVAAQQATLDALLDTLAGNTP